MPVLEQYVISASNWCEDSLGHSHGSILSFVEELSLLHKILRHHPPHS